jgi:hypothetical protein
MKKRTKARAESDAKSTREHFNDSGDYMESQEVTCTECGKLFKSSRIVWSGKPWGVLPTTCPRCERDLATAEEREFHRKFRAGLLPGLQPELTPFPLPPSGTEIETRPPERWLTAHEMEELGDQARLRNLVHECALGGDKEAVTFLIKSTWEHLMALNDLVKRCPELVRPFSRKEVMWPGFIGKGSKKKREMLIKRLELGKESPYQGPWHPDAPSTKMVIRIDGWLKENSDLLRLPVLTDKTRDVWFERGWKALLEATNNRPDQHPFLAEIGRSAVRTTNDGKADRRGMSAQTEGMKRDDVIAKIKEILRKTFSTYTKFAPH